MAEAYHDGVPWARVCSNSLEVWVTAACRVLDRAARVSEVGCDQTVDMLEVLPSWDPVVSCFGGCFWEVVLKVARIDVLKNVPQDLAVLYVLPALYFLGRLECLHLTMSADGEIVRSELSYPFEQGCCQLGGSRVCHLVPAVDGLYAAYRLVESTAEGAL